MKKGVDYIGVGTGAVILNNEGKVFITQRGPKARNEHYKREFPGGGVEFGEKCEDTIVREVKEEFDMDIEVIELLEVVNHIIPTEKQHWVSPSYIAKHVGGVPKIMEPEKCIGIKRVDIQEIVFDELSLASQQNYKSYIKKNNIKK